MALLILLGFITLIALPSLLWLYALADSVRNDFAPVYAKIVWIAALFLLPPLGTLLYYLVGRSQRTTSYPVGRLVAFCVFVIPLLMIAAFILYSLGQLSFLPEPPGTIQI